MKNQDCIDTITSQPVPVTFGLPPWIMAVLHRFGRWHEIRRQRQHLARLDDYMLRDIGLSRADATFEYEKPFWQL